MRKIIIDCDPGHDDAMALFLAVRESELLNILAVGTVGGNHHLDKITRNAQLVLETLNSHVPLYAGCPKPLLQALPVQPDAHGASGMDGLKNTPKITYPVEIGHAVDAYRDLLQKEKDVTFVALGPLTNLALLIQLHPEVLSSIREVSLMGGGIHHGNITPYAEFNIFADPESAKIVFESGIPILMSGLDVTEKAYLTYEDILSLKGKGSVSQFAHELLEFYYRSGQQFGFDVAAMHDACAVAVLTKPELFHWEELPVEISMEGITRGMTCADRRVKKAKDAHVRVVMDVIQSKFADYLLDSIMFHDRRG